MRVLVACEESQAITIELRNLGHEAYSCDLQEPSGGYPEWHIMGDCTPLLNGHCSFVTADGTSHSIDGRWDLLIAHPPCTYLAASSAIRLFNKDHTIKDVERWHKGEMAREFFMTIWNADCDRIVIENPAPLKCFKLPPYSQIIEPYMFGDPWRKRTCLWLRNCPPPRAHKYSGATGLMGRFYKWKTKQWSLFSLQVEINSRLKTSRENIPRYRPCDCNAIRRYER